MPRTRSTPKPRRPAPARPSRSSTARVRDASARRRTEHRAELRGAILAAATRLLADQGYEAFSLRRLAERIGYSATTIYLHFRDKDDLVVAVMTAGFALFAERLRAAVASSRDPFEQLRALADAYVTFGLEQAVEYRVMFMQRCELWERLSETERGEMLGSYALLEDTVRRVLASGRTRRLPAEAVSAVLWAQVHGLVTLLLTMPKLEGAKARDLVRVANEIAIHGLLAR